MKRRNMTVAKATPPEPTIVRILKRATCASLSGKSSLVYEVGVDESSQAVMRVVSNSGHGCFSSEWVKVDAIRAHLDKAPKGETVTSHLLAPLFRGVSQNTAGFVWAGLVHAGFVAPSKEKKRAYERADPSAFLDEVKTLIDGKSAADGKPKRQKSAATPSTKPKKDKPSKKGT